MYFYAFVSVVVLFVSFLLFRRAAGTMSLLRLNIVSWIFYYQLCLLTFVGVNLSLFGVYHYRMSLASEQSLLLAYWSVCYVMIMMPSSMIITEAVFSKVRIRRKILDYFGAKLVPLQSKRDSSLVLYWVIMSGIAFMATVYTYYHLSTPPLIASLLSGTDPMHYAQLRIEASREFGGSVYIRNLFSLFLAPFVSYIAYGYYRLYKTLPYKFWFYFTAIIALMAVTYSGAKAPAIQYFITLFIIKTAIDGGTTVKALTRIVVLACGLIILLYVISTGGVAFSISGGPLGRVLMGQVAALPLTFDIFPQVMPFLNGASFPSWIVSVFGIEHFRSARILMEIYSPAAVEAGTAGVMNTLFIAEAWANFGYIGLFLAPVIVGVIIQSVYNLLITLPKTPTYLAVMGYFIFGVPITGGFVDFIWNVTWLVMAILIVCGNYFKSFIVPTVVRNPKKAKIYAGVS